MEFMKSCLVFIKLSAGVSGGEEIGMGALGAREEICM